MARINCRILQIARRESIRPQQHCTYPANAIEADVTGYLVVKPKKIAHGVSSSPPFHFGHAAAKASVAVKTPRLRRFAAP
jgi:hypothetical protein